MWAGAVSAASARLERLRDGGPHAAERHVVVAAWLTRAKDYLERLAREIASAQGDDSVGQPTLAAMHRSVLKLC